jgi:hypothetical protein
MPLERAGDAAGAAAVWGRMGAWWIQEPTAGRPSARQPYARTANPAMVVSILAADASEPEAGFDNAVDMLDWLNRK